MKNTNSLESKTTNELQVMAKKAKIPGWHKMRKSELVFELEKAGIKEKKTAPPKSRKADVPESDTGGEAVKKSSALPSVPAKSIVSSVKGKDVVGKKKTVPVKEAPVPKVSAPKKVSKKAADPVIAEKEPVRKKTSIPSSRLVAKKNPSTQEEKGTAKSSSPVKSDSEEGKGKKISRPAGKKEKADRNEPVSKEKSAVPNEKQANPAPGFDTPANEVQQRISQLKEKLLLHKTIGSSVSSAAREAKDQLILMVRDPFWLHAYWEISALLVERIRAAMGHLWHTADPILRLYKIHTDNVGALRQEYITDIQIHGGINNWYIDVDDPPSSFMVEIGYLARDGQFFVLLSSNIVETPQRYIHDAFGHPDVSWMGIPPDICSGVFGESFEEGRFPSPRENEISPVSAILSGEPLPMAPPIGAVPADFSLNVDSEVVIRGKTEPGVQLTIKGETIRLKEDGSFSIRYHLPERRHVFPVVAISPDGLETRTVILAFERNTKVLDIVSNDDDSE
ncbi:MAG: DUF4912 domain-containing protein [Planctomycetia bacterium]|nr:DUF4912 domain-containing protein [Planctomycetia bacterium]